VAGNRELTLDVKIACVQVGQPILWGFAAGMHMRVKAMPRRTTVRNTAGRAGPRLQGVMGFRWLTEAERHPVETSWRLRC
jgi:hypothetical protein